MIRIKTVLAALLLAVASVVAAPTATFAAEAIAGPLPVAEQVRNQTGDLETKLTDLTEDLSGLGRPLAVLALVLAVLSVIAAPALPDWAAENRGMIRKVLFSAMVLGIIPDLVTFVLG